MTRAIKSACRIAADECVRCVWAIMTISLNTDNLICAKSETYINFNCCATTCALLLSLATDLLPEWGNSYSTLIWVRAGGNSCAR